jgi:3-hydroxyisobutyrate dehydrogenase-like beta-hydroxyacid dehydrogenase
MSATSAKGTVGIIGMGIMGGAIARNLVAAGWRVVGHDIAAARRAEAASAGVEIEMSASGVAAKASAIITSLPAADALDAVVREIAIAKTPRRLVVEASTFSLDDKNAAEATLRTAGHVMLDCPLSGTGAQAKVKDLVVYASGDSASIAVLAPLFADFARETHDLGAFGNGSRMKFVANLLVAVHNVATAEAFVLGMKAGLDPRQILKLVAAGAGTSRVFELRGPMMAQNRYAGDNVTMKVSLWRKDMSVIGEFARALGCPTPMFSASEPIYAAALSNGHAGDDTASVCSVLEAMAGLKRD